MIKGILNYFSSLNTAGQALFVVGVLLIITFIVLLIIVLKPEKNVEKVDGGIHRIPKITENKIQKMNTTALRIMKTAAGEIENQSRFCLLFICIK